MGQFTDDDLDDIARLPTPTPPALSFVSALTIAASAARAGVAEMKKNRHERSMHVVTAIADRLAPPHSISDSPEGWARNGARQGIIDAWTRDIRDRPLETTDVGDRQLYSAAYALTSIVVTVIKQAAS